ncbi:MAG: DUF4007 family protein [Bacteroidota bacterium]|nr:DUF4007 family protein [Bacteroidota bacterium]
MGLIKNQKRINSEGKVEENYLIERDSRDHLPVEVFLYAILDNEDFDHTISFSNLISGENFPGNVFLMNRDAIFNKIKEAENKYSFVRFSQTAGNQVMIFDHKPEKFEILNGYYAD